MTQRTKKKNDRKSPGERKIKRFRPHGQARTEQRDGRDGVPTVDTTSSLVGSLKVRRRPLAWGAACLALCHGGGSPPGASANRQAQVTAAPNPGSRPCVCPTITRTAVPSAVAGAFPLQTSAGHHHQASTDSVFWGSAACLEAPRPRATWPATGAATYEQGTHTSTLPSAKRPNLGTPSGMPPSILDHPPSPLCLVAPTSASLGRSPTRERFTRRHFPLVRPPASTCSAAAKSRPQQKNNLNAPLRRISQSSSRLELRALVSPLLRHRRRPLHTGPSPKAPPRRPLADDARRMRPVGKSPAPPIEHRRSPPASQPSSPGSSLRRPSGGRLGLSLTTASATSDARVVDAPLTR